MFGEWYGDIVNRPWVQHLEKKICTVDVHRTPARGVQTDTSADEDVVEHGQSPPPTSQAQASPQDVSVFVCNVISM